MNLTGTILGVYVALACLSCVRDKPTTETDASASTVASKPALVTADVAAPSAQPSAGPAAWAMAYEDTSDLPQDAGNARCTNAPVPGAKPASVLLELTAKPPGLDISIPSLGVKQHIWTNGTEPSSCRASLVDGGKAMRFHCSEDLTSIDGKIYTRRSDIVLARAQPTGTSSTKFVLPCGTPPKLEPIACPKECKKEGDACTCGTTPKK